MGVEGFDFRLVGTFLFATAVGDELFFGDAYSFEGCSSAVWSFTCHIWDGRLQTRISFISRYVLGLQNGLIWEI